MKTSTWFALAGIALVASTANAHTHLKSSVPAEGSVVRTAPANIVLKFSEATRVTALTLQKDGGAEEKLTLPAAPTAEVSVPTPKLEPGKYVVSYRVVGDDNHVMSGKLQFTVDPKAAPVAGTTTEHDHDHKHEGH